MANLFDGFYIGHVSRSQNTKADALAVLATTLALPVDTEYTLQWRLDTLSALNIC